VRETETEREERREGKGKREREGEREREREREREIRMKHTLNFPIMLSVQKLKSQSIITPSYIFWLNLFPPPYPVLYYPALVLL